MEKYYEKSDEDKSFIRELVRKMFKYHDEAFNVGNVPDVTKVSKYVFILETLKSDGMITNSRGKKLEDLLDETKGMENQKGHGKKAE